MNVDIFIPCFVDQLFPQTGFNMVKVLEKAGCRVLYDTRQTCCGQPAFNAGYWNEARDVCMKFIREFSDAEYIVTPSASCAGFLRNYVPGVLENSSLHNEAKHTTQKVYEFTEFMIKVLQFENTGATLEGKATYHDSCAGLRECRIKEEPRRLLANVKGLELAEMQDVETCCGFGGTFAIKFEPISIAMAEQKVDNALATGAKYLVSTDHSCLMHLGGYIRKKGYEIETLHIADVLATGW